MSFKPIHDLESLNDQQREQYYLSACEYFQVPPELRLLDFMWMETNDGRRNLVLYSKKGATDLIRANLKISVTSTTRADGPGYVAFIVEGRDGSGRTEQAVGSAAIEGLRGQGLANAVMISHTRATRRLTLQFVGGGLLDESEVNGPVTDINRSGASLASLATLPAPIQPSGAPNTQPGKDITPLAVPQMTITPLSGISSLAAALSSVKTEFINGFTATPEQITAIKLKPSMVAPAPFSSGSIIPTDTLTVDQSTIQPLVQIEPLPEPKKRHRRTKAEMAATRGVISLDIPVSTPIENQQFDAGGPPNVCPTPAPLIAPEVIQAGNEITQKLADSLKPLYEAVAAEPVVPIVNPDMPTAAEVTAWKAHLSAYTERQTGILAQGGMTENVFGKIRLYTMKLFPNAIVLPSKAIMLTNTQWKTLLDTFSKIVTEAGPVGLVRVIEDTAK